MAAFDTTRPTYGTSSLFGRFSAMTASLLAAIVDWNDARATRQTLGQLNDRELADIGLCRADIDRIAEGKPVF
ncbi:DUF1127 domain-containing protein [Phaeobacter porticola]|uniref:Putative small protein n=1 Tax=Phaeobacter porticola TaxID=1844006 RepID=A0A1L3I7L3_9RHOB|nr:DUF1127 domain-containing protein [Phaeobacter porticola]APG48149.1 putative small protein [Phaeobacter porticola]